MRNVNVAFLPIALLSSIGYQANAETTEVKNEHPNILFILADDLGWNDVGCMGSTFYETPHIDSLASKGVKFTNAYSACTVSSPSRSSIMTGQYTPRHGITDWIGEKSGEEWRKMKRKSKLLPTDYNWCLPEEEYTIAECLKDNGYTTFMAGKWHMGDPKTWPEDHGFEISVGAGGMKGGYFAPFNNPKLPDNEPGENLSIRLGKETIKFMKEHQKSNPDKPFFAYLSFYAVHGPIQTNQKYWSYFREKAERMGIADKGFKIDRTLPVRQHQDNPVYAGVIKEMDDAIGMVLHELRELGLDKNTLVIFTSDNGGVTSGDNYSTSLLPLRGGKGRQWEGGIRVPLIYSYPGCKSGSIIDTPVTGTDFYPTILDYARLKLHPEQHKDGVSIMPLLNGKSIKPRSLFWHYPHYGNQGGEPSSIIRKGEWKLIYYYETDHCELYNLSIDLGEHEPLNAQYPEKVKELRAELMQWLQQVDAKRPVADPLYSPVEEAAVKNTWHTRLLKQQEKLRKDMLDKNWKPNENWWDSMVTID